MQKLFYALRRADRVLLVVTLLLFAFGATIQYSVNLGLPAHGLSLASKQILFFIAGLALYGFFMSMDYRLWQPLYPWLYALCVFFLLLLFTPLGEVIRGVRSWLSMGFFVWQPVELIKVFLVLSLAAYFSKQGRHLNTWKPLLVSGSAVALLVLFSMAQPDIGSASILFFLWLGFVLILGLSKWQVTLMVVGFVSIALCGWLFILKDYQRNRLMTFIDPSRDPRGSGYNLTQSIIAIGSGGLFGKGIGYGSQSQLRFLPETQSDFVFAVIGEELGLAGVVLLLTLYGLMIWRLIIITQACSSDFGQLLAVGVLFTLSSQVFVHIGINMGLLPVTGVSLPFISSGGSYMLAVMMMLGLAQSVAVRN